MVRGRTIRGKGRSASGSGPGAPRASCAVERLANRLEPYRGVATRSERGATRYLAMVTLAALLLWM